MQIGTDGKWLRYHRIVQDFLQQRFQEEQPEMAQALQLRLAEVFEERGEVEKAFALLRQIGALDQLTGLVERAGAALIINERLVTLRSWLDNLPAARVQERPALLSLQGAYLCTVGNGKGALPVLDRVIKHLRNSGDLPH